MQRHLHTRGHRKLDNLVSSTAHPSAVLHLAALESEMTLLQRGLQTHQARSGSFDVGSCRFDTREGKQKEEKSGASHKKDTILIKTNNYGGSHTGKLRESQNISLFFTRAKAKGPPPDHVKDSTIRHVGLQL